MDALADAGQDALADAGQVVQAVVLPVGWVA